MYCLILCCNLSCIKFILCDLKPTLQFSTSILHNTDVKTMSGDDKICLNVDYNEILKAQNDSSVLIIDVREKEEIDETGKLPGSIHIPMGDVANTLSSLSEKDFKERFKKEKPSKNTKIILSCRSGKRSGMVQEEIRKLGYENAYNYVGGWLDWESNQKV
ncbi:thiosulfate sulfurtransferase/rhodanese-like domain-containing protein 3 isoform X3 [Bombus impatiens]|uniref:Thiosulfate sulfurtransferase/rhodanese-like domain-containing protein 3 isoform X3 n=1 Tax=Bombus impatiens TaxID=132113 RepID=A0A6P3DPM6_BOMIM|nr:thiosulfate sulfurtransferase/rhodanese-like domain-containing protein 3 isoform X3 [Bombus impatiens]